MKALLSGVGVAAVAGVLLGAAMKPNLGGDERPAGPQIMAGWSANRSTGPFDEAGAYAGYSGQIPDYVVGTDWKKALVWPDERIGQPKDYREPRRVARNDGPSPEPLNLTRAAYGEPPTAAPAYPSLGGGVVADWDTPPPVETAPAVG